MEAVTSVKATNPLGGLMRSGKKEGELQIHFCKAQWAGDCVKASPQLRGDTQPSLQLWATACLPVSHVGLRGAAETRARGHFTSHPPTCLIHELVRGHCSGVYMAIPEPTIQGRLSARQKTLGGWPFSDMFSKCY